LSESILLGADVGRTHAVAERLAEVAPADPLLAAECLQKIISGLFSAGSQGCWTILGVDDHLRDVLSAAIDSGGEAAVRTAWEVANVLVANEFAGFEGLG